ncbi:MAG: CusA/CzcA family heavy metal efflux RND transporter [Lutibacter sp.]|nr:MAG: CusA/CzcA family heavy metal efflux RND transporter [Lutibacter sp.]
MIDKIIRFSIQNKFIIGLLILALIGAGTYSMMTVKLGSVPDITNNQVQVITVAPNLGTEDIEQFVTYPIELAVANLPSVVELRSVSRFGLSVVTIVFKDDMGTYLPRQLVQEKLADIKENIPKGFGKPFMAPIATGLGEIYQYSLVPKKGYEDNYSPTELRTIQDWIVKRQMALIPGVVEINSFGGNVKQYEIALNPNRLKSMGISINEILEALENNNSNTGGAYIERNHQANFIRGEGLARTLGDIENIVIKNNYNTPILIKDVADAVRFGKAVRFGAFTEDGQESVGGQVLMLKGENPNEVIKKVKKRIENIQKSLPEGIEIKPFLDRSDLISRTTSTVSKNLIEGALIVVFVLVLLLGSLRGGLLTASIIPLSLLFAFILMKATGVWANLMSLGAIDFGIIVDGAVIIVEGTVYHIEQRVKKNKNDFSAEEMDELAYKSSSMMMNSAFFGQLIILIVFTPILFLTGVEGKMFRPMAFTFGYAVLGALILCLTYVPVMASLFMKPTSKRKENWFVQFESWLSKISNKMMSSIFNMYAPLVKKALIFRRSVIIIATLMFVIAVVIFSRMGGEFIPKLDEGDIAMQIIMKPGSSLTESIKVSEEVEYIIKGNFPEVKTIVARIGVSEIPTDPMPMDIADCFIILEKDTDKWTSAKSKPELVKKIRDKLKVIVGVNFIFTQPVELRFNELLTGVREDVAIKLYGNDLTVLATKAEEMAKIIQTVQGAADVRAEATDGLPQITIIYQREKLAKYGLTIDKLNRYVSAAFAGADAGTIFEGEKRFDLVVRFSETYRKSIDDLRNLFVDLPNSETQIPLKELANISYKPGPMQISRDNTYRRVSVGVNVRGRDVESMVEEVQQKLEADLDLPDGYFIEYGGSFENLKRAKERLSIVVPIALFLIFILLYFALNSVSQATMIYMAVPLSAIGGIYSLSFRGMPFSISAGVGFVVLFGVAVLNGLVLVSRFNSLKLEGKTDLTQRILIATKERLRPILLTAVAAIMGFVPMAISASAGAEVQRPLATVVIGGLISSTLLTLLVIPVLYYIVESRSKKIKTMKISKINTSMATFFIIGFTYFVGNVSAVAQENNQILSLEEVITIAFENNPTIKAANLEIEKQQRLKKSVFDIDKTAITYSRGELNGVQSDYEWNVSQDFKFPTVYGAQLKLQKEKIVLSQVTLMLQKNNLERNVKALYMGLLYTKNKLKLISKLEKEFDNFAVIAHKRFEIGDTNLIEKMAAEAKLEEVRLQKTEIYLDVENLRKQLQLLLNFEDSITISNEELNKLPFERIEKLGNDIPNLRVQKQVVTISEREYNVEKSNYLPDLTAGYFNQQIEGVKNFTGFQLGVKIPIFFWSQKGKTQAAKKNNEIAQMNFEQSKLDLNSIFQTNLSEFTKHEASLLYYETRGLQLADTLYFSANKAYKEGEIGYVEYITTLEQAVQIKRSYLDRLNLYNQTIIKINYLIGKHN